MKGLLCALALLTALLGTNPAIAGMQQFQDFSVDVPKGWSVERDGLTVAFRAADDSAAMSVTVEPTAHLSREGVSVEELAQAYAAELQGSKPVLEEPGCYSFTFTSPDGLPSEASIVVSGRRFYLITISGKHENLAHMVESVLLSIP
jgi:hypothetical protein